MSEQLTEAEIRIQQRLSNDGKQLNLRIKDVGGRMILLEDVLDYSIDQVALRATYREITSTKVGDKIEKVTTIKKMWFNTTVLLTVDEEWK